MMVVFGYIWEGLRTSSQVLRSLRIPNNCSSALTLQCSAKSSSAQFHWHLEMVATTIVSKMATVQEKLKAIKSKSPKVLTEKYQGVFDQLVAEETDPQRLQQELEVYLTAGNLKILIKAHPV